MGAISQPRIKFLEFVTNTTVTEPNISLRVLDEFMGKIICYENGDSGPVQVAGTVEGFYIIGNYFRDGMSAYNVDQASWDDAFGEDIHKVCEELSDLEQGHETLDSEVRDLSGCDLENPDVLVICDIYLKPEFRHKGL